MKDYYKPKEVCEILGIHFQTLRNWSINDKIPHIVTNTGRRYYKIEVIDNFKFKKENEFNKKIEKIEKIKKNKNKKRKICYCRVSSYSQKKELQNQINYMKNKYKKHEILYDIGSGINFKRKNLIKIIEMAINNELHELVISYKDRLCRIGYELIESLLIKYSNTKIIILKDDIKSPEEELTNDLIEIITVFSSKIYGMRSYKIKN